MLPTRRRDGWACNAISNKRQATSDKQPRRRHQHHRQRRRQATRHDTTRASSVWRQLAPKIETQTDRTKNTVTSSHLKRRCSEPSTDFRGCNSHMSCRRTCIHSICNKGRAAHTCWNNIDEPRGNCGRRRIAFILYTLWMSDGRKMLGATRKGNKMDPKEVAL